MKRNENISAGTFLVAEPFMSDPYFKRSVVLLCDHHPDGTFGFILNKSVRMNINELLEDFPEFESEVFYGGPVSTDTIHFIHNVGDLLEDSQQVGQGIYWGGDFEKTVHLINNGVITCDDIRFFLGYSAWSSLQLDQELSSNSWIVVQNEYHSDIIQKCSDAFWKEKITALGGNYLIWSNAPENPSLN